MHTHLSLWRDERNAFVGDGPYGLSAGRARASSPACVHHAGEITAVTNQWVNSYKRLVPGHEAPVDAQLGAPRRRRARARALGQARARGLHARRVPLARTRRPTPTCASRSSWPPGCAAWPAATSCPTRASARRRPCPSRSAQAAATSWRAPSCSRDPRRPPGRVVPAQQARRVGRLPRPGHRLRARPLPAAAVIDVVLCVPSCEGPVRKAFEVTGVTPAVAASGRLNEVAALEPADGYAGAPSSTRAPCPSPRRWLCAGSCARASAASGRSSCWSTTTSSTT